MNGYVHSLESFGSVDGPGVRYVIFLQGCRMRCQFCHNPDTWNLGSGQSYTADELLKKALRYRVYWRQGGGITVSGGEPLLQMDFLLELFDLAKRQGVHTVIDTAGAPFTRAEPFFGKFQQLMQLTDLVLLDLKMIDEEKHRRLTGVSNRNILDLARHLSVTGKPVWIRHVLVPQRTDAQEDLTMLSSFLKQLHNIHRVEVLPYHTLGKFKWENLGIPYPLEGISPPTKEQLEHANRILETASYTRYLQDETKPLP